MPEVTKIILSKGAVKKFCELCNWAYTSWRIRSYLLQDHPDVKNLMHPLFFDLFSRLQLIVQEHWMLQLAKLHDPAITNKRFNLTIEYIVDHGSWDPETEAELTAIKVKLESLLREPMKMARNKFIAHNDLVSYLEAEYLGSFEQGKDGEYFEYLQNFCNLAHDKVCGEIYPFDDLVDNDINIFMDSFKKASPMKRVV